MNSCVFVLKVKLHLYIVNLVFKLLFFLFFYLQNLANQVMTEVKVLKALQHVSV